MLLAARTGEVDLMTGFRRVSVCLPSLKWSCRIQSPKPSLLSNPFLPTSPRLLPSRHTSLTATATVTNRRFLHLQGPRQPGLLPCFQPDPQCDNGQQRVYQQNRIFVDRGNVLTPGAEEKTTTLWHVSACGRQGIPAIVTYHLVAISCRLYGRCAPLANLALSLLSGRYLCVV